MWKSLHHMTDNDSLIHLPLTHYKQSQWPHFPSRAPSLNYLIWWVASLLLWKQEFYENQTMNTLERLLNLCVYPLQWLLWDAIKTFKMFFFASDCPTLMFEKIEILHSVNNIWWGLCVCPPESPGTFLSPASCQTIFKCIGKVSVRGQASPGSWTLSATSLRSSNRHLISFTWWVSAHFWSDILITQRGVITLIDICPSSTCCDVYEDF